MTANLIGWKPLSDNRNIASARLRCFEPARALRKSGVAVELFRSENLSRYSTIVLQKCNTMADVELAATAKAQGIRVVYDLCDNLFHLEPDSGSQLIERADRVRRIAELSDLLTVSTSTLREIVEKETGKLATIIPDPVIEAPKLSRWRIPYTVNLLRRQIRNRRKSAPLEILWYGNSSMVGAEGGLRDLLHIAPLLEELHREHSMRLTVISNSEEIYQSAIHPLPFPTSYVEWKHYSHFCSISPGYDVCVIPISQNPFTRCKSNNRIALSLYLGIAVVADSIPSYQEFAPFSQLDNWIEGLREYATSPGKRREDIRLGRAHVLEHYTLASITRQWNATFMQLAEIPLS